MADFWGLAVAAAIGSAAWLYQKAWERREARLTKARDLVECFNWLRQVADRKRQPQCRSQLGSYGDGPYQKLRLVT